MPAPNLDVKTPLAKLRRYTRYTLQKLRIVPWGKALGLQLETVQKEIDSAMGGEQKLSDTISDAETVVDICDLDLNSMARAADLAARGFYSATMLKEVRENLFGPISVSDFSRPLLGAQLRAMKNWPKYLATLASPNLKALIPNLETALKASDNSITALTQAEVELASFRTGTHAALVRKVDMLFHEIWAEAVRKAKETGITAESLGLFMSLRRNRPPLTLTRARAELAAREEELQEAQTALAELEAEAKEEVEADHRRLALEQQIAALKKNKAETDARIKALEDELDKD